MQDHPEHPTMERLLKEERPVDEVSFKKTISELQALRQATTPELGRVNVSQEPAHQQKINLEIQNIKKILDDPEPDTLKLRKRRRAINSVVKMSNALAQYKQERNDTEEELIKTLNKVNLDKMILCSEKQKILWNHLENKQVHLQNQMKKTRAQRFLLNQRQKKAYQQLLQWMKERATEPVQEEMQIMDGLFIMLNNGWTVKTEELLQSFDLIDLRSKSQYLQENIKFYEFLQLMANLFEVDLDKLKAFFNINSCLETKDGIYSGNTSRIYV